MKCETKQTALTAIQNPGSDIEEERRGVAARLKYENAARLFNDESPARSILRVGEKNGLLKTS
jgi:hypothetical protein